MQVVIWKPTYAPLPQFNDAIVGAGSAECVLAIVISPIKNANITVLFIEAGGMVLMPGKPTGSLRHLQPHSIHILHNQIIFIFKSSNNHLNLIHFYRVVKLWNALLILNLELSAFTLKEYPKSFFRDHFIAHFHPDLPCTWHYLCPCSSCFSLPFPLNLSCLI